MEVIKMMGMHNCRCGNHMHGKQGCCCEPWFLMTKEEKMEHLKEIKKMLESKIERIDKVLGELGKE